MDVLFLTKARNNSYGISVGLLNSATFLSNALNEAGYETQVLSVVDGNDIDRHVHKIKPRLVSVEALWVTPKKIEELVRRHPSISWQIRIHSKIPFLANEGIALQWLREYIDIAGTYFNLSLSTNNEQLNRDISRVLNFDFDYLPNIYSPDYEPPHIHKHEDDRILDVGCFGAIRPLKNHLQQAFASIIFADKIGQRLRFHINAGRTEQKGDVVLQNLRGLFKDNPQHKLIEHGWLLHHDLLKEISRLDIGMQVSLSESFNITCADYIHCGIPIVVSTEIDWAPWLSQANPNNLDDIVSHMGHAYRNKRLTVINTFALKIYNKNALNTWDNFLKNYII